jgi:hypothetical protein
MHSAALSIAQPHNQTAISVSALVFGWYVVIRSMLRLAVADGKRTILSFIYLLLFKEKTPAREEKLQTARSAWRRLAFAVRRSMVGPTIERQTPSGEMPNPWYASREKAKHEPRRWTW